MLPAQNEYCNTYSVFPEQANANFEIIEKLFILRRIYYTFSLKTVGHFQVTERQRFLQ